MNMYAQFLTLLYADITIHGTNFSIQTYMVLNKCFLTNVSLISRIARFNGKFDYVSPQ